MTRIIRLRKEDVVPEGAKFLHAVEEEVDYKVRLRRRQDSLSWLWANPNFDLKRYAIMDTVFYYEVQENNDHSPNSF
jgi:hypothetical protein